MAVFWVVAPCSLVEGFQRFRGPCCLHHQGDNRNVGKLPSDYTTLQPRRQPSKETILKPVTDTTLIYTWTLLLVNQVCMVVVGSSFLYNKHKNKWRGSPADKTTTDSLKFCDNGWSVTWTQCWTLVALICYLRHSCSTDTTKGGHSDFRGACNCFANVVGSNLHFRDWKYPSETNNNGVLFRMNASWSRLQICYTCYSNNVTFYLRRFDK
jgi:hypothetical protein